MAGSVDQEVARRWDPPAGRTVARYRRALRHAADGHASRVEELTETLSIFDSFLDPSSGRASPAPGPGTVNFVEARGTVAADLASAETRLASAQALLARTETDPASLFLPVGALVRTKVPARPASWRGDRLAPPAPGSLGVVVGPADGRSEWSTTVAFEGYVDAEGRSRGGDIGKPLTLNLDADDLEVVTLARFLDGEECRAVEFTATHARNDNEEERVMVVESNSNTWTIEPVDAGPDRWLSVQGWASRDELDHLRALDEAGPGPAP